MKHSKSVLAGAIIFAIAMPSMAEAGVRIKAAYAVAGEAEQESDTPWIQTGDYTPITLGLSYIDESGFFVDLSYATSSDPTVYKNITGIPVDYDYERTDTTLSFGAAGDNGWAGYMGIRVAEGLTEYRTGQNDALSSVGLVMGGSKAFALNDRNIVALSAGLGVLQGTHDYSYRSSEDADITVGFSAGASYAFKVNSNITLGVEYKYQQYAFDFTTATANAEQITETLSSTAAFASLTF